MASYGRAEIDLRSLRKGIRAAERAGADLRPVLRSLRTPLRKAQRDHLANMKGITGAKFAKLAQSTVTRRLSRGGKAKKFTKKGKLRKGASRRLGKILSKKLISRFGSKVKVTKRSISFFARGAAGHALHGGTMAGRKRRSRIPARPYVYVDDSMSRFAFDKVARYVAESLENANVKR